MNSDSSRELDINTRMRLIEVPPSTRNEIDCEGTNLGFCKCPGAVSFESFTTVNPQTRIAGDKHVGDTRVSEMGI
jgi:hypothetical protein